jgi:hypothetical protein
MLSRRAAGGRGRGARVAVTGAQREAERREHLVCKLEALARRIGEVLARRGATLSRITRARLL